VTAQPLAPVIPSSAIPASRQRARTAALGLDALAAARQTGSARILGELQTLGQRLTAQWPAHPATRAVREAVAA
jgi:hypothetical protein